MTNSRSNIRIVAYFALAYVLLGAVGLMLAIPPGYASPIFPAAGLALACALWFGHRVLPGVWLGSALLNLSHAWLGGTLDPGTAVVAVVIATGATLQAEVGRRMVNRWQGPAWRDLEREQDAIGFLLLGGVLACVLSASISVTGLYAVGIIERAKFSFTWWNWYVGDVLGVLVFAPLTLCLLNRPDGVWYERRRNLGLPSEPPEAFRDVEDHVPAVSRREPARQRPDLADTVGLEPQIVDGLLDGVDGLGAVELCRLLLPIALGQVVCPQVIGHADLEAARLQWISRGLTWRSGYRYRRFW